MSSRVAPSDGATNAPDEQALKALRDAFAMIDTDNSGTISATEFGTLLRLQGEDISDDDAQTILEQIDVDGDATNLTFDEFVEIMAEMTLEGGNKFDIASAFAKRAKEKSTFFQAKDPLYVKLQREAERKARERGENVEGPGAGFNSSGNARMQLASIIDGNTAQVVIIGLIVIDVVCVIMELLLVATKCPCKAVHEDMESAKAYIPYGWATGSSYGDAYGSGYGSSSSYASSYGSSYESSYGYSSYGHDDDHRRLRVIDWMEEYLGMGDPDDWGDIHRILAGGKALIGKTEGRQDYTCVKYRGAPTREEGAERNEFYNGRFWSAEQHHYELILHWTSVGILFIFAAQIFTLLCLYGVEFFKNLPYVFDAVVIGGAIYVEMEPTGMFTGGSLFAILLFWRCLRVVHGLASSLEMQHKRSHEKMKGERGKMLEMIVATRRKGAEKKLYFLEFNEKLLKIGVKPPPEAGMESVDSEGKEGELDQNDDDVHTAGGSALETAMHFREGKITHEELKARLDVEKQRCGEAESMFVEIYEQLEEHMDGLKLHTDALGVSGHGHHEDEGAQGHMHKQNTKGDLGRAGSMIQK
mmetsp:Transcript_30827/g.71258  ORF Transcript_30827/g.71258 Transcript_30827/m.71258 type:complete len:585 (-) Transcript_30827:257-2011(-)